MNPPLEFAVLPAPSASEATAPGLLETSDLVRRLRALSLRSLARMYSRGDRLFVFRVRRDGSGFKQEGLSPRYTAIALLGLAQVPEDAVTGVLGGDTAQDVCTRLVAETVTSDNLGDVALTHWAAGMMGHPEHRAVAARLTALKPLEGPHAVVELAWTLTALSEYPAGRECLRDLVADRLMSTFHPASNLFPHIVGATRGPRAHVSCFADLIYPIQALSKYALTTGNQRALDIASACATRLCDLQGDAGQWWWHYDYRSARIIERYPVYAIHQDAMGPMGLFALLQAGGPDFRQQIRQGLRWLEEAPELNGGSLIDTQADLIWRKVARREPRKAVRYLQATASRIHPAGRVPGVDVMFPAKSIDFEDRPYHLGWLLYAWSDRTIAPARRDNSGRRQRRA